MINWKNILERAMWTFIEAFLCALPVAIKLDMDGDAWKTTLFSAACAGVSAVKTFIIEFIHSRNLASKDEDEPVEGLAELIGDQDKENE
jgi:hypothetical protein